MKTTHTVLPAIALIVSAFQPFSPSAFSADILDVAGFEDSAQHYREVIDTSRAIARLPDQQNYKPGQIREIADNILVHQHDNGGWAKDYDMMAILSPGQVATLIAAKYKTNTTFDNNTTHIQTAYLAKAYCLTGDVRYRDAAIKGVEFIIAAQYDNGGWPQSWPNPKGYAPRITFNDGVMVGNLRVLRDIVNGSGGFLWADAALRARAKTAWQKGEDCLYACQLRTPEGTLTGWAQQYDEHTLKPAQARKFEYPGTCSQDTPEVMEYLMEDPRPTPRAIASLKAAAVWIESAKLTGFRIEEFDVPYYETERHKGTFDRRVVQDPSAPAIWARIYDINTNKPVMANRDGTRKEKFEDLQLDRRVGYNWFGYWPAEVVEKLYPAWCKKHNLTK